MTSSKVHYCPDFLGMLNQIWIHFRYFSYSFNMFLNTITILYGTLTTNLSMESKSMGMLTSVHRSMYRCLRRIGEVKGNNH